MKEIGNITMDMVSGYIRFRNLMYLEEESDWYDIGICLIAFDKSHDYFLDNMDGNWDITEIESVDGYCEL